MASKQLPVPRRLPAPAVDDEILRLLGHFRVEVVLDHAVGGFAEPGFAGKLCTARRADSAWSGHGGLLV